MRLHKSAQRSGGYPDAFHFSTLHKLPKTPETGTSKYVPPAKWNLSPDGRVSGPPGGMREISPLTAPHHSPLESLAQPVTEINESNYEVYSIVYDASRVALR